MIFELKNDLKLIPKVYIFEIIFDVLFEVIFEVIFEVDFEYILELENHLFWEAQNIAKTYVFLKQKHGFAPLAETSFRSPKRPQIRPQNRHQNRLIFDVLFEVVLRSFWRTILRAFWSSKTTYFERLRIWPKPTFFLSKSRFWLYSEALKISRFRARKWPQNRPQKGPQKRPQKWP